MPNLVAFIISLLLLNSFNPKGMLPLDLLIAALFGLIWYTHRPKKPKKRPPTTVDVWATIRSAQKTVDDSYNLIHGDKDAPRTEPE